MKKQTIVMQIENEQSGKVTLSVSDYIGKATLHSICQLCKEKHKGAIKVELSAPYKSRTTGKGSQNNKFYALVTEICKETGNDLEDVKDALKERACARRGYPYTINKLTGKMRPYSTTKINTVQMAGLIEEAIQLCAELGIVVDLDTEVKVQEDTAQEVCAFLGIGQEKNEVDIF